MPIRSTCFTLLTICIICSNNRLSAQSYISQREVINFERRIYNAGTQNWKIREDNFGRIYFANNDGLLVFDGKNWQLHPLPNKQTYDP